MIPIITILTNNEFVIFGRLSLKNAILISVKGLYYIGTSSLVLWPNLGIKVVTDSSLSACWNSRPNLEHTNR